MKAANTDHADIVNMLMRAGADKNVQDKVTEVIIVPPCVAKLHNTIPVP